MVWAITAAAVVAVFLACVIIGVIRYNQLSLARDVCRESRRQLMSALSDRRALVPSYRHAVTEECDDPACRRALAPSLGILDSAFAAAGTARSDGDIARREDELSKALVSVDDVFSERLPAGAPAGGAASLYEQLCVIEARIIAAVRYCNMNIRRYERRRTSVWSLPVRARFPSIEQLHYENLAVRDRMWDPEESISLDADAGYRPGQLSEDRP